MSILWAIKCINIGLGFCASNEIQCTNTGVADMEVIN